MKRVLLRTLIGGSRSLNWGSERDFIARRFQFRQV